MYQRMRKGVGLVWQRYVSLCFVFAYHASALGLLCGLQVFRVVYCLPVNEDTILKCEMACKEFVELSVQYMPEFSKRLKVHVLLHLSDNLKEFGSTNLYNTERYGKL